MPRIVLPSIILAWSLLAAPDTAAQESHALSQCAVVQDGVAPRLFLALPSKELAGIDVGTGRLLWQTPRAAFPLLARGNRLLALLPPAGPRSGWLLGVLDATSGAIVAELPPWGTGPGTVDDGMGTSVRLEGRTERGRDYVVWRSRSQRISGVPGVYPVSIDSGAAEVDLVRATLMPLPQGMPDRSLAMRVDQPAGYHTDPFDVEGLTAVAAREYAKPGFRLLLHRWRGREALPDVVVSPSAQNNDAISVSEDRRHVLGVAQLPGTVPSYRYNIVVFSAVTGQSVGRLISESYPATFVVVGQRIIQFIPDRVAIGDLVTGRSLYQWNSRDIRYHGPYPPAARRNAPRLSRP